MTNIPRDHTGRPIRPTDLADLSDPTPPLSPRAQPTEHQKAAMEGAPPPQPPRPPRQPGSVGGFFAWIVIIAIVGFLFVSNNAILDRFIPQQQPTPEQIADAPFPAPDPFLELQGRYLVGSGKIISSFLPEENTSEQLAETLATFGSDDPIASLRLAMIAAELAGVGDRDDELVIELPESEPADSSDTSSGASPDDSESILVVSAHAFLNNAEELINSAAEPSPHDAQTRQDIATLRARYANPDFDSLDITERNAFIERHGWVGQIALSFGDDDASTPRAELLAKARRTALSVIGGVVTAGGAFIVGFILFILAIIFLATGTLKMAFGQPTTNTGPYAEVFALFLVGFLGVGVLADYLTTTTGDVWWSFVLVWLLPFVAIWPRMRGIPKDQWKLAIGWHSGKGIVREVLAGILGYLAGLPIVAVGIGCTLVLIAISAFVNQTLGLPDGPPTHPIADQLDPSNTMILVLTYITACVWAPFVEETIFRGALYQNTRKVMPSIMAALFTGLIFAAIHPQGWIAIPSLMSLGVVFALLREWRGSIIAPAVAHAINNGFVFTLLIFALS
ncbi:MAG: lysostaphin resistance A-like protein [Planctomycetota bacterium]|jgi:membrane protease YdiL (CAAX protease family)